MLEAPTVQRQYIEICFAHYDANFSGSLMPSFAITPLKDTQGHRLVTDGKSVCDFLLMIE